MSLDKYANKSDRDFSVDGLGVVTLNGKTITGSAEFWVAFDQMFRNVAMQRKENRERYLADVFGYARKATEMYLELDTQEQLDSLIAAIARYTARGRFIPPDVAFEDVRKGSYDKLQLSSFVLRFSAYHDRGCIGIAVKIPRRQTFWKAYPLLLREVVTAICPQFGSLKSESAPFSVFFDGDLQSIVVEHLKPPKT